MEKKIRREIKYSSDEWSKVIELYTMMRYLQADMLKDCGINHFDEWAADFGEVKADYDYHLLCSTIKEADYDYIISEKRLYFDKKFDNSLIYYHI